MPEDQPQSADELYATRLRRYVTALRNEQPDQVPIRPFVAEFAAKYAGFTCQDVTHDYEKAFTAVRKCAADFDWDAVVGNLVYVWTGLTEAIGLKYYGVPGIDVPADVGFQYREPRESDAFMKADEYDALTEDPTGFLFNVWLPRASADVVPLGAPVTHRHNMSFLKGGLAMLQYFSAFGPQNAKLRSECGTVSAISGILKAPLDILADKLRGYVGLAKDLRQQPKKVQAACETLMPHLLHVALSGADPDRNVPVGLWMHRGCVPFVRPEHFDRYYWPTLKPIVEELWSRGHQTLFYAEGNWGAHLERFAELPAGSIVYHVDRGDIFETHRKLGGKFCLSGGVPNTRLSYGSPDEVRACCREIIDRVAGDGGYIMDASAIIQNDARVENMRALTDATREYGVYSSAAYVPQPHGPSSVTTEALLNKSAAQTRPGVCVPWEQKRREYPDIPGDADLVRAIWEQIDALGHMYIWHCLLSF